MLNVNKDERGTLVAMNFGTVPFTVKRFMYIHGVPKNTKRGAHAHRTGHQLIVCLKGTIKVETENTSGVKKTHKLTANKELFMPALTWAEQTYSAQGVVLVLCSKEYDEGDYIRDYEEFKKL